MEMEGIKNNIFKLLSIIKSNKKPELTDFAVAIANVEIN